MSDNPYRYTICLSCKREVRTYNMRGDKCEECAKMPDPYRTVEPDLIVPKLSSLDLSDAEKRLCESALHQAGSIVGAADLLGCTKHALKRRIIKHHIEWPPRQAS